MEVEQDKIEKDENSYNTQSLDDIKNRIVINYDRLKGTMKNIAQSLHLEKQIEGEIISSSLLLNNVNLMTFYVESLLKDLAVLEVLVEKSINNYGLSKKKEVVSLGVDHLLSEIENIKNLLIKENLS